MPSDFASNMPWLSEVWCFECQAVLRSNTALYYIVTEGTREEGIASGRVCEYTSSRDTHKAISFPLNTFHREA